MSGATYKVLVHRDATKEIRIEAHRRYPYAARRMGLEGIANVRMRIQADGRVTQVHVTHHRVPEVLKEAGVEAVRSSSPFPPLPSELRPRLIVQVPIRFTLDR